MSVFDTVSRETADRLQIHVDLLKKWNRKINLVSPASVAEIETRHVADSLQLLPHVPAGAQKWVDLGSGGGFPGLVIAIALADRPDFQMTLIESDQRKCAFLRTVLRETGVNATVIAERIEDCPKQAVDVVSARALAPLASLLALSRPFLTKETTCLFLKGRSHGSELALARMDWKFDLDTVPSMTDIDSAILVLREVTHV